jgi:chromosome segregation and condensation protein ScpB
MTYGTSEEFLCHFGLNDLSELPDIDSIDFPATERDGNQNLFKDQNIPLLEEITVE